MGKKDEGWWSGFRRGLLVGLLIFAGGSAAVAWIAGGQGQPPLSSEQKRVLVEYGFDPVIIEPEVQIIEKLRYIKVPAEVPVREAITVEATDTVPAVEYIEVPADCPEVGPVTFETELEAVVAGVPPDLFGKGHLSVKASGPGDWWTAESNRDLKPGEITFSLTKEAADRPRWRRRLWLGALGTDGAYGPVVSASLERGRWAALASLGAVWVNPPRFPDPYQELSISPTVEPVLAFQVSRRRQP